MDIDWDASDLSDDCPDDPMDVDWVLDSDLSDDCPDDPMGVDWNDSDLPDQLDCVQVKSDSIGNEKDATAPKYQYYGHVLYISKFCTCCVTNISSHVVPDINHLYRQFFRLSSTDIDNFCRQFPRLSLTDMEDLCRQFSRLSLTDVYDLCNRFSQLSLTHIDNLCSQFAGLSLTTN